MYVCVYIHTQKICQQLSFITSQLIHWLCPCESGPTASKLNEKSKSPIFTLITNCCIKLFSGRVAYVLPFKFVKICSVVCAKCYYLHCHISWLSGLLLPCCSFCKGKAKCVTLSLFLISTQEQNIDYLVSRLNVH